MSASSILKAAFIVAAFVGIAINLAFLRRLRHYHSETWRELGSPTLIMNNSISNALRTIRFVWSGEYRVLDDTVLDTLATVVRIYTIGYIVLFVSFVLFG